MATVKSCQKLPLCPAEPIPGRSERAAVGKLNSTSARPNTVGKHSSHANMNESPYDMHGQTAIPAKVNFTSTSLCNTGDC